jgi:hypothetical protein
MKRTNRSMKSRLYLYLFLCLPCLVLLMQYATSVSLSRSGEHRAKARVNETTSTDLEKSLFYNKGADPRRSKAAPTKKFQDPSDDPGEVQTVEISGVTAASFDGDVQDLPQVATNLPQRAIDFESQLEEPETPIGIPEKSSQQSLTAGEAPIFVAAPGPIQNFAGLSRLDPVTGGLAGAGFPPDTNGDVGLNHYIQAVNDSYAIYDKATGTRLAAFTENSLFSSGPTGTLCDTNTFGDPIVIYDQLANRWILTNLAFVANPMNGLWNPPLYQCFAASKTGDPVAGGWWLYAVRIDQGAVPVNTLHDYPKFGSWNDGCLYMGANGFSGTTGGFTGPIFASFSKNDMYNGLPLTGALGRIASGTIFSLFPSNLLGKIPNYFVRNATTTSFGVRKFTPGANCGGGGILGAETTVSHASATAPGTNVVPQPNDTPTSTTHLLDSLGDRLMQKVQYRKVGSAESVWVVHSTRPVANGTLRPQWAQLNVTGGTVATTPVQQQIYAPDATLYRWMGSLAADNSGDMAMGYSTSNGTVPNFPSIAYSGRLVTDPLNTLPQTETQLIAGLGTQLNNCGGAPCHRWGDYSSMSIDPYDDCTFWYTQEYYDTQASGTTGNWHTRIGSFRFPSCSQLIAPTITCPASFTVSSDPNSCGAVVNFTGSHAASATGSPTPTITYSPPSGSNFPVGSTTVTATATNSSGSASCTFTVTVNDTENPTITCPADIVTPNDTGQCSAVVNYTVTSNDNCPGVTTSCSSPSGSTFPVGTTPVICTATDASGNTASCSFNVTVNDTEKPVISCPADIVTSNDPGQCSAVVNYTVTAKDNCPGVTVVSNPPSGSTFPKGTTTVTSTATDASGNTASCTFTVTVNDTENPVISCPADIVVSNDPGQCSAVVNYSVTAKDNCPGVTVASSPPSGSAFPKGTTTVTSTATDASGNTSSCSFTVTVNDTEKPVIACPANIVTANDPGQCSAVVNYSVTARDNCPGVTVVSNPPSGSAFPKGTTTVISTATDASGNTASCSFTVTVNDTEKPTIACPSDITVTQASDAGTVVNFNPVPSDNCPGVTTSCTTAPGSTFPVGTTHVMCTATDTSSNTASCSFSVLVVPPSNPGGSFVIGDLDAVVGQHVTFWGAQWAKLNSLSGGSAPSSFKGFANSTTPFPPTCGGTWQTDPGNSSSPPGSVPTFIAVMASSSITKSGSTIAGNTRKMVIVRVDPGYEGNPGHAGTGTVIAVICQ